jgi:uncharacterized membrane protein YidH (DUF202 family)
MNRLSRREEMMNRGTGTGLMALGAVLAVIGAIMRYAVHVTARGFSVHTAGIILLIVGIILVVVGLIAFVLGSRQHSTYEERVDDSPYGTVRRSERDQWSA